MTPQQIIYLTNNTDHLVILLILMWISANPTIIAFR